LKCPQVAGFDLPGDSKRSRHHHRIIIQAAIPLRLKPTSKSRATSFESVNLSRSSLETGVEEA
jgi:hypothetical protein